METILRSKEMVEITFLPIRHHSPACAWHVKQVIEELRPALLLVEGPCNANELIPLMTDEETKAPFSVYYSYRDRMGRISGEKGHYRCYYPFLDYSPELVALREGGKLGIETAFIDLPYAEILAATRQGRGLLQDVEKPNYNDDYLLSRNRYLQQLCEKAGLRSFDEFWEKYFEIRGIRETSETWFSHLSTYCELARRDTPQEALEAEGCLEREAFMAARILEHAKRLSVRGEKAGSDACRRIVVVTGGFHTAGLKSLVSGEQKSDLQKKRIGAEDQEVYIMPYSMEAADALNGYASGMPCPGFYQKIWEGLEPGAFPYHETVLDMLVTTGKAVRRKSELLSTYDEICALQMADGLAALRGKPEPGAYELRDAVLSAFIKGECNLATDQPLRILKEQMTGRQMGKLGKDAAVPPIICDFEIQCKRFGIKSRSVLESEVTLSLFAVEKHRCMSMFLQRVVFLQTGFARRIKGPNLQQKKDHNLIREIWKYKWNTQVSAALIDVSVYGGTVEEAAVSMTKQRLQQDMDAGTGAMLLTQVFEMGLEVQMEPVYQRVHELLLQDADFYSLTRALQYFLDMQRLQGLYRTHLELDGLTMMCCQKLITCLPSMTRIRDEDSEKCMNACKLLYQITGHECRSLQETFFEALTVMEQDTQLHPGLDGCIHGILYGSGRETSKDAAGACRSYLMGTHEQLLKIARFFRGLFFTARDLVFIGSQFTGMLDHFLGSVEGTEFMELLPELRMAFGYFTPGEIDRIAEMAAGLHGKTGEALQRAKEVLPGWYTYGKELDAYVMAMWKD